MKNLKIIVTCFVISISMTVTAQEKNIKKANQQWVQYYNQTKLGKKWILFIDGGYRWKNALNQSSQYIVRAAMGYKLNANMKIRTGFAHLGFYTDNQLHKMEFRPYQEFNIANKYNFIGLKHRFRIEERFFNKVIDGKIQSHDNFNFRFRYRLMLNVPIIKLSSTDVFRKISLNVGDEIMVNAGNEIIYNIFEQNRILIGPVFQFNQNFAISITYNSQFASTKFAGKYKYTDVIWIGIKHKLNFTNNKKQ